jgi:hypothetical protein
VAIEQDLKAMGQELEEDWVTAQDIVAQDSQEDLQEVEALAEAGVEALDVDIGDVAEDFGVEIITQILTTDQCHITETATPNPTRKKKNPTLKTWSKV